MNTSNKSEIVDLLILGAGVAGCATALSCAKKLGRVLLLNASEKVDRIESFSIDACQRLKRYSINAGVPSSEVIAWWGSAQPSVVHYRGARIGSRRDLANQLREAAGKCARIATCKANSVVIRKRQLWEIEYRDERGVSTILSAQTICDATGRRSAVGRAQGAFRKSFDTLCCAAVSAIDVSRIGTFTEAVSNGWWNLCSDGVRGTLTFYSNPHFVKNVKGDLRGLLEETKELKRLASVGHGSIVHVSVCDSSLLSPCAGPGWFAVGDAAATFQPITSVGTAKALRDAQIALSVMNTDGKEYDRRYANEFSNYLAQLKSQYELEQRWANSAFWN